MEMSKITRIKYCATCRWCGCRNYGKELSACENYIISLEEQKRIDDLQKKESEKGSALYEILR